MQRLLFEKAIDLNHHLTELISINVNDHLAYTHEANGMRATGDLEISGEYLKNISRERFNDTIALDIFAPEERMDREEEFYLEVSDFDYRIQSGNLYVEVTVLCHGILEKDEKRVEIADADEDEQALIAELKEMIEPDPHKDELKEAIEQELQRQENLEEDREEDLADTKDELTAEETNDVPAVQSVEAVSALEEESDAVAAVPDNQVDIQDDAIDVEDLFDDDSDAYVVYRIYVVSPGDTYASIALRYGLDESYLANYYHDAPLAAHQLLLIPD